ncbi:fla cluster protein FlaG [Natronomonas moolapensis 8.8.11]|uniref:Fla cluster protein FlaG n=1 Tax=Natronomonas moolapensis (strain DSM 18674 / CECT 7526 / JCM 14361 / 8.8.11) TaxID=268739 RepID=M1XSI9_NATM8|nr:fla cluster protein FlaG [Natronomonas moolapensis]CCQ37339.1 fla cluster protein FlaG [Natronomonas moolapensis 8.8.11]
MSGVSASTLVIFIASILVAAGVAGTLVATVGDISNSAETKGDAITESIDADFEILNDGGGSNFYDGTDTVTFYVRNTGSNALFQTGDDINVLINGQFVPAADLTITSVANDDGSADVWAEGEVLEITVALDSGLDAGGNRLSVSTKGTERSIEFSV